MSKGGLSARSRSRRTTLQALYQWQLAGQNVADIEAQYLEDAQGSNLDVEYFCKLFRAIVLSSTELDARTEPLLDRPVGQLDPIEKAILRIATYELCNCLEIPWRVIINESVELAKAFGGEQSHRYINSVVDKLAKQTRKSEIGAN